MRLALVTETFPPEVNGVSMTLGRLCDGLAERGWDLLVVRPVQEHEEVDAPSPEKAFEEFIVAGVPLPGYSTLRMGEPAGFSLHRIWKEKRPDVVHIATEGPLGVAALIAAKLLDIPVSSTFHTNFDQYSDHYSVGGVQRIMSAYLRMVHNFCGCTLAPTQQMAEVLTTEGYFNTGVLSRGVDTQLFSPTKREDVLRNKWEIPEGGRAIVYVGRIAKEKNIDLVMQAYRSIVDVRPKDRLILVGGGPELERLKRKYPDVYYAGMQKGEDLAKHYASGDIFLFASVTETFGNVVTEAMASGLAVCTYDYAAGREYVSSGKNGVLARFGDGGDFVAKALSLCSESDEALDQIRLEARKTAEGISWDSVVESFQHSLYELVERNRG
ncbi:glycosyltransferase family 1 protein [Pelagicoccus sp. SDUM812002]|uniref:glycosyltransferase family 4 protein n=1 Tax=Pelagicoccus sp. SDUM812002 TaxID=3041266 RepID=UPI00280E1F85|nr:glycosyltransferase family 1 protein [Pelagicoccus sp. SDUM812002]MDQ8185183.1 glycosyltransferase family 1 protein [Pelagicoccus sp. SDUM812002]